ncbi:Synaptotagmin-17 [Fukomys damarensis]|uniref:Synaptotagmin-17 n=1 Tax=Fukomys damarensis TaxID=885580 RepID=A0A091DDE4_FUKDA|nr:Synaptotagmin-17 [Fukomys damarensis]
MLEVEREFPNDQLCFSQGWAACNFGCRFSSSSSPPSLPPSLHPLPAWPQGFLSRISDLLLCRWTCRHCCQKCYESSCCQSSEDEVEILGPFPAQTPPWLIASRSGDKDGDSVHTASDVPLTPRTSSPDGRRSSSDTSKSTYSLTRRISSLDSRRPSSPLIDIKPIEFGVLSAKKEPIQPSVLRRTYTPDDYFRKFEPQLYSLDASSDDVDALTDEEILSRYQLGMLHFSTQYDLLHNHLTVRVIEARDLPPPIAHDGSRQDMAHSNPYVKICLLPDQKNSKQTGVKRKTQKPVFEERYTFDIPFLEAQRRTLLLTMVDFDKFSRHCVIGKVSVPLCEVDLVKGGHWWKALIPSSQKSQKVVQCQICAWTGTVAPLIQAFHSELQFLMCEGLLRFLRAACLGAEGQDINEVELGELLLSLNYLPSAGRLNVDIIRAKQLLQTDVSQGSDPFVKIQLVHGLKLVKTKKTSFLRGTIDPFYNESFSFKVPQEELENASLVFTVFGHNMKSSNDFIGRIVIGQYSSGPSESNHWRRMLSTHRTAVEQWHSLRSRADCDRVSPASLEVT